MNEIFYIRPSLALIHSTSIKVKKKSHRIMKSFENCIWKVSAKESTITLVAIYRLPYSNENQTTINVFLDKFTEWMTDLIAYERNILLLGNFNIHVNNDCDKDSKIFTETIDGLGLQQHINFSTHRHGNYLDLIIVETFSNLKIRSCKERSILSDHSTVEFTLSFPREELLRKGP